MAADLNQIEERLRAAYADVAATVQPDDISEHAPTARRPARRHVARTGSHRTTALAAAAAVLLIVITATVIPQVLLSGPRHRSGGPGALGRWPHSHMAYIVTQRDLLVPVNLATGITFKPIPLGVPGFDAGVVMSPDRKLVYVVTVRGQLVSVDLTTGKADPPIGIGGLPQSLVITPDGKTAYVLERLSGVVAVDLASRTVLGLIKVHDADGFALTPGGKTLYVLGTAATGPVLTAIDTATNRPTSMIALRARGVSQHVGFVGPQPVVMAPGGRTAYAALQVLNMRARRWRTVIIPVDLARSTELKPIYAGAISGFNSQELVISPDSETGYITGPQSVIPIDFRTGALHPSIPLPASQMGYELSLSPDGSMLYVVEQLKSAVIPINTATSTALPTIQLGAPRWNAWGGVFASGGKTFYVLSDYGYPKGALIAGRMTPVDTATGTVGKPIDVPAGLHDIVVSR